MALYSTGAVINYIGNGINKEFQIPFAYTDINQIFVWVGGTELQRGIHYSVSAPGVGGSVTLGVAPALGAAVRVARVLPLRQTLDLHVQGPIPAQDVEDALDRIVMMIQQLNDGIAVVTVWDHGIWPGGDLHALVTNTTHGFMPAELYAKLTTPNIEIEWPGSPPVIKNPVDIIFDLPDHIADWVPWDDLTIPNIPDLGPALDAKVNTADLSIGLIPGLQDTLDGKLPIDYKPDWEDILNTPTTIAGYGIGDVYTKTEVDDRLLLKKDTAVVDPVLGNHEARITALEEAAGGGASESIYKREYLREGILEIGDLVCLVGSHVMKADPANPSRMPAIGVVVGPGSEPTTVMVQVGLIAAGVYAGLTPGRIYYVGLDGRPTIEVPMPGSGVEYIEQEIGIAASSTDLRVAPSTTPYLLRG